MNRWSEEDPWVWVVVQDPGRNEQFLGQHDQERDVSFIPFFREREEAQAALFGLARDATLEHEPQAIRYRNLAEHAGRNGFRLFLLDGRGAILEKLEP
jgi:hypothetical protein